VRDPHARLQELGFSELDARILADHFLAAEEAGKLGHGLSRVEWLATQEFDPEAKPERVVAEEGFERWEGRGAAGYLVLAEICRAQAAHPPRNARVIVAAETFPTGMLGYWVRRCAEDGLVAALTTTSPRRLAHPDGGPKLTGTNPLAIAVPSSDGRPIVVDVSMSKVPHGDVIAGLAAAEDVVPFGGEQAYKSFALSVGLQLLVDSLTGAGYGAVMVVARPEADPVPAFRKLAEGVRLPGDRSRA
jgi:LDH2 family malate/lactate/ureidoglycolate dehydrogenase